MTTVACVFVRGHVAFTPLYVIRLAAMVRRWMDRPYRFVCLTDRPQALPATITCRTIPSPTAAIKGWWSKIELFNPRLDWHGRVLYLDLDTLIVGSLAPILDFAAPFALVPHAGTFEGKHGLRVVKRFNSSVMVWNAGRCDALYTDWHPAVTRDLWGDQDYIGEHAPDAATMPARWFPRLSECTDGVPPHARVILAKTPKNEEAARRYPWFRERWM